MVSTSKQLWSSRFGFYLAAIGSAFGLGNLWRFPFVIHANGGGAFVLLYVLLSLLIGLPLLIGELMMGKHTRRSMIGSVNMLLTSQKHPRTAFLAAFFARVIVFTLVLILAYYSLVSGWVLHFLLESIKGLLTSLSSSALSSSESAFASTSISASLSSAAFSLSNSLSPSSSLLKLKASSGLQIGLLGVHLTFVALVVGYNVHARIEKWVSHLMPFFFLIVAWLVLKSLQLPMAPEAIRYLFYPDFNRLSWSSWIHALGHVFFSLSIGFGSLVTFGSYLNKKSYIPLTGARVVILDTLISLVAGLLIFPVLMPWMEHPNQFTMKLPDEFAGPELIFMSLPQLFATTDKPYLFAMAFFIGLYAAALGASVGIFESIVNSWSEMWGKSRANSARQITILTFIVVMVPVLTSSIFEHIYLNGHNFVQILDSFLVHVMLPLTALGMSLIMGFLLKDKYMRVELMQNPDDSGQNRLYSHWLFILRYAIPFLILFSFGVHIINSKNL